MSEAPTCPVCGEPATGWDHDPVTGHHLTPCGHYVSTLELDAFRQAVVDYITQRGQADTPRG